MARAMRPRAREPVSVSDNGVGIAAEDQDAIFEEFRQVGTGDAEQEGTGSDWSLCRKFIELHGGRIRFSSQPGWLDVHVHHPRLASGTN